MNNLDYGVIGNCRSAALVSEKGSIDWCCMPDFDSPSVFAKILDKEKGGCFSLIVDDSYDIKQKYLEQTNILCTEFTSEQGSFEIIDFMPRYKTSDNKYFTPSEVYRYIRYISGSPVFRINYNPMLNYARDSTSHITENDHIRTYSEITPTDCIYLYSSLSLKDILQSNEIRLTSHQFLLISYNQKLINIDIKRVYLEYKRTKVYWLNWTNRSSIARQQRQLWRSCRGQG